MNYLLKSDSDKKSLFNSDTAILVGDFVTLDVDWAGSTDPGTYIVIRREFVVENKNIKEVVLHFEKITDDYNAGDK